MIPPLCSRIEGRGLKVKGKREAVRQRRVGTEGIPVAAGVHAIGGDNTEAARGAPIGRGSPPRDYRPV